MPYFRIRTITLDTSEKNVPKGKVLIIVYLTSPPLVANVELKSPGNLHAKFLLQTDAVSRFMEALRRRGVVRISIAGQVPYSLVTGKVILSQSTCESAEKAQEYLDWFGVEVHKRQFSRTTDGKF